MAQSTGPILVAGGLTIANEFVTGSGLKWAQVIATGATAMIFAGLESVVGKPAVMLAWVVLTTAVFVPLQKGKSTPAESLLNYING